MPEKKLNKQRRAQLADGLGTVRALNKTLEDVEADIAAMIHDIDAPMLEGSRYRVMRKLVTRTGLDTQALRLTLPRVLWSQFETRTVYTKLEVTLAD